MLTRPTSMDETRYKKRGPAGWILLGIITVLVAAATAVGIYFATNSRILAVLVTPPVIGLFVTLFCIGLSRHRQGTLIVFGCLLFVGLLALCSFVDIFRHWTTAGVFAGLAFLIIPGLIILSTWFTNLADYWNWNRKASGGAIFGDLVNFVGVAALVNARRGLSGDGWWWLAMFAGFLALLVGASLQWRWLKNNESDQITPMMLNLILAVFTAMSLFANPPTPADQFKDVRWLALSVWYVYLGGLGIFWAIMLFSNSTRVRLGVPNNRLSTRENILFGISLVILYLAPLAVLIIFPLFNMQNEITGLVMAGIGVMTWALAELFSVLRRIGRWARNMEDWTALISYLEWEKNWWQTVAGYAVLIYIIVDIVGKLKNANAALPQEYESILLAGLLLGATGALRGVVKGIIAKPYEKYLQEQRGQAQPRRNSF